MKNWSKSLYNIIQNPDKRKIIINRYTDFSTVSPKKTFLFVTFSYSMTIVYFGFNNSQDFKLKLSISRKISQITGFLTSVYIPQSLRVPIYEKFSQIYNVNLDEIEKQLQDFENFSQFFTRSVKPRYIDKDSQIMVSPCDSKILQVQEITQDELLLVKGQNYYLGHLLTGMPDYKLNDVTIQSMKKKNDTKLLQIIFYLAPGDYHKYHSPIDFVARKRLHIPGYLYPVKISFLEKYKKLYENNERVCLFGEGQNGLLSMIFVGALNVGSISLKFDKTLQTNKKIKLSEKNNLQIYEYFKKDPIYLYSVDDFDENIDDINIEQKNQEFQQKKNGIMINKGQEMGQFNMGSTIVMVVEVNQNAEILIKNGDTVRYGQQIIKNN